MEIKLMFEVPVVVMVDLAEGDVTQVVVCDESSSPWRDARDDGYNPTTGGRARRAIEIADGATWPAWEFGF